MLAVNYSTIRSKLKEYCDRATDEMETVIITRKNEKNVVLMSLEQYNQMMKALKNTDNQHNSEINPERNVLCQRKQK